jgi:hypothetical protein
LREAEAFPNQAANPIALDGRSRGFYRDGESDSGMIEAIGLDA